MDPVAENVSTHCLKSLVVLSLANGREGVCGKEGFSMPEGIIQWSKRKLHSEMTREQVRENLFQMLQR